MNTYREETQVVKIWDQTICDRCGENCRSYGSAFKFEMDKDEESQITINADLCFDCGDILLQDFFPEIANKISEAIPNALKISPMIMEWPYPNE
jgi:hypothetical protein